MKDKYHVHYEDQCVYSIVAGSTFDTVNDAKKCVKIANEAYREGHKDACDALNRGRITDPDLFREEFPSPEFRAKVCKLLAEAKKAREEAIEFAECVRLMAKFETKLAESKPKVFPWLLGVPPLSVHFEVELSITGGQMRTAKRNLQVDYGTLWFTDCTNPMQNAICDPSIVTAWRQKAR